MTQTVMPARPGGTQLIVLALAASFLVGCSGKPDRPGGPDRQSAGDRLTAMYARAQRLTAEGRCGEVEDLLFYLAMQGRGFEDTQTWLGNCILASLPADTITTGQTPSARLLEGLLWLRRAAEAGRPEAQVALAGLYLEGPVMMRDPYEAAMWLALYERNMAKIRLDFAPPPDDEIDRLTALLTPEQRVAGQARADGWTPIYWRPHKSPVPTAPRGAQAERPTQSDGRQGQRPRRRPSDV